MKTKRENPLKVLFSFSGEARGKMTGSVILAFIGEMFGMAPYFVVTLLAKELYEGTATVERAAVMAVTAAVCMCLRAWLTGLSSMRSHTVSFTILKNIRCALADKMAKVPMGVMLETPSGTFKTLMVDNVGRLEDIIAHMVPELPSNLAGPVFSIILVFVLDWRMGLAAFITVPLSLVFAVCMMRGYKEKMAVYLRSGNEMNAALVEYVGGIQVVKAFSQSAGSYKRYSDAVTENAQYYVDWMADNQKYMAVMQAVIPSVLLPVLPVGLLMWGSGSLSTAVFLTIVVLSLGLTGPLVSAMTFVDELAVVGTNVGEISAILEAPELERPAAETKLNGLGIRLDHVSFAYKQEDGEVLHDVSLDIRPGTVTALVGPSGSGKSTCARLAARLWDVTEGTIRVGGVDISTVDPEALLTDYSMVFQDVVLFDDTVMENIRLGKRGATDEEVRAAAEAANCGEFIRRLPQGYDTPIGENGAKLSGGERQRISIARCILKDAPIVILDEATASVDADNESYIQQAISELVQGKTLLVIAHRLNTIRGADQILVISDGEIAQRGTHQSLMEEDGIYRNFVTVRQQSRGWNRKDSA